jgi:hypothetical protein
LHQGVIGHRPPLPDILDEFVFPDQPSAVFHQIAQYFIREWPQVDGLTGPQQTTARKIQSELPGHADRPLISSSETGIRRC